MYNRNPRRFAPRRVGRRQVHFAPPPFRYREDPEMIFSPSGCHILSLPGARRPVSPAGLEVPCRPRKRHDPSLVDMNMNDLPPPVDDEEDEFAKYVVHRVNPCCLCKVGYFHGAMNFGIISTGLRFFMMFYCIYVAMYTEEYTLSFLKFWGIDLHFKANGTEMQKFLSEIHDANVVGAGVELFGVILGLALVVAIIMEKGCFCAFYCVKSTVLMIIEIYGVAYFATRFSLMILIAIAFLVLGQAFGLWVMITYIRSLGDPRKCPMCRQLIAPPPPPSDHSLPTAPEFPLDLPVATTSTDQSTPESTQKPSSTKVTLEEPSTSSQN